MVVTLGQQYNIGEKSTVILYTYISRHVGTTEKQRKQNRTSSNMVVIISCYILGYEDEVITWRRSTPVAQLAHRNLLTRWDVSSIPANGIFLTKNLKTKIKCPTGGERLIR